VELTYDISTVGDAVVITPAGELDVATAPGFRAELFRLLEDGPSRVVLSLGELSFVDSSGLSAILAARQHGQQSDVRLVLAAPRPNVLEVLQITALDGLLPIYDTVDEALAG
jgi:anti-sigma B factor antagonist